MAHDDIAILRDGTTIYRTKSPQYCAPIQNAAVGLIQAIYDHKPEQARRIVRQRIYTTLPLSESVAGIVKVAAKRITGSLSLLELEKMIGKHEEIVDLSAEPIWRPEPVTLPLPLPSSAPTDAEWIELAQNLARKTVQKDSKSPRYASDRPIAALLVSGENALLGAAINTNAKNRTLHAEMNLIANLADQKIPPGARLFTTLKPCKMCAGMIHDSATDLASLRVIFAEDDPGTHGRNTALDRCPHPIQSQLIR
ncbi:MAG: Bd3614 family nucleic acid deaminase [Bdellovibrionia bacterium]